MSSIPRSVKQLPLKSCLCPVHTVQAMQPLNFTETDFCCTGDCFEPKQLQEGRFVSTQLHAKLLWKELSWKELLWKEMLWIELPWKEPHQAGDIAAGEGVLRSHAAPVGPHPEAPALARVAAGEAGGHGPGLHSRRGGRHGHPGLPHNVSTAV